MTRIGFVLLHYNNIEVTCKAVKYIQRQNTNNEVNIVIVDNASPNGTGRELSKLYEGDSSIEVILNKYNLGFAKGNNIGYVFAKNQRHCNLIVVMNTDIYIEDTSFIDKLLEKRKLAEVIAPDICARNGVHQNPFRNGCITKKKLREIYVYNKWINRIYNVPGLNYMVAYYLERRKKKYSIERVSDNQYNVTPHGACIIYTEKWIEKEDIVFDPNTFMYMEEDVLMDYIQDRGYRTVYCPDLIVKHMEDASTDFSFSDSVKRRKFISGHTRDSARYLMRKRQG